MTSVLRAAGSNAPRPAPAIARDTTKPTSEPEAAKPIMPTAVHVSAPMTTARSWPTLPQSARPTRTAISEAKNANPAISLSWASPNPYLSWIAASSVNTEPKRRRPRARQRPTALGF